MISLVTSGRRKVVQLTLTPFAKVHHPPFSSSSELYRVVHTYDTSTLYFFNYNTVLVLCILKFMISKSHNIKKSKLSMHERCYVLFIAIHTMLRNKLFVILQYHDHSIFICFYPFFKSMACYYHDVLSILIFPLLY